MTAVGLLGLVVAPLAAPVVWLVVIAVGMSGSFPLALSLIVLRSRRVAETGRLSSMAQSVAFLVAAAAFVAGELTHRLGSWQPALLMLLGSTAVQAVLGYGAAKARFMGGVAAAAPATEEARG